MLVIPAIDLKDGQCVRLRQGDMEDSTVFSDDPVATAERWAEATARRLHMVDLNGAFAGKPKNAEAVRAITRALPSLPVQIGGGIRDCATIESYLNAGVSYVNKISPAPKSAIFWAHSMASMPVGLRPPWVNNS